MPGNDYSRSLTEVFMKVITKDNKHLTGKNGSRISVARQVPKYLMPKKKDLDQNDFFVLHTNYMYINNIYTLCLISDIIQKNKLIREAVMYFNVVRPLKP